MSTEKEISFPIDDFMGVNRLVSKEDIEQQGYFAAQNMWEKKLGELETRGHSQSFASGWPATVTSLGKAFRVYKSDGGHRRFVSISHSTPDIGPLDGGDGIQDEGGALPSGFSLSFNTSTSGRWLADSSATLEHRPIDVVARFIGYGKEKWCKAQLTSITNWTASNVTYSLDVTITSALVTSLGFTPVGVEILGNIYTGLGGDTQYKCALHIQYIDLTTTATGTWNITGCPVQRKVTAVGALETGEVERTYALAQGTTAGSLISGKTYYVSLLSQHYKTNATQGSQRLTWRHPTALYASQPTAITLNPGVTSIKLTNADGGTNFPHLICIGDHPQLMKPWKIVHLSGEVHITEDPLNTPCVMDIEHSSATEATLSFRAADYSHYDMFTRVNDSGTKFPLFLCRQASFNRGDTPLYLVTNLSDGSAYGPGFYASRVEFARGNKYRFVQDGQIAFFVNGNLPTDALGTPTRDHNLHVTDGAVSALAVMDYDGVNPPRCEFIAKFRGKLVMGGGDVPLARSSFFYTKALEQFDWEAGTTGIPNYIPLDVTSEPITGVGIFTTTTTNDGPQSKLLVTKKNSMTLVDELPDTLTDAVSAPNTLSAKAGCIVGDTIANTPIGTIVASSDNVYLLRESGEPIPLGDSISAVLRTGDLSRATATYHEEQYKLSFYHSDYSGTSTYNNVEFWLDIRKMKQLQGKPGWVGPMIGRQVDDSYVEDMDGDATGDVRYAVDSQNLRFYKCDVIPSASETQVLDFATPVTSLFETKDYQISDQDKNWNKLLIRTYWKTKINKASLSCTEVTYMDGSQFESKTITFTGSTGAFDDKPLSVVSFFPTGRPRGRTVRKRISTTDRIAIGGFSLNYKVERRRI
jgi:hypothetical protein